MTWYELFPERLVLEVRRVQKLNRNFKLRRAKTLLYWEGEVSDVPSGIVVAPLRFLLLYMSAYPATPPEVTVLSPNSSPNKLGHDWHRYNNGNVCYVRPTHWRVSTTADEVIEKVADWYFNYTAKKAGLVDAMPDVGRAVIEPATNVG
jgi:hypothetical protein